MSFSLQPDIAIILNKGITVFKILIWGGIHIVGYTVGNFVLRRRASGAVKRDFRTYIRRYTSPNLNFEYGYRHSNAPFQFRLELKRCKPHKAARHPTKCGVINDVKQFPTVYRRIYCRKFLTLSNQMSRYKIKCIRIQNEMHEVDHGRQARNTYPWKSMRKEAWWISPVAVFDVEVSNTHEAQNNKNIEEDEHYIDSWRYLKINHIFNVKPLVSQ